MTAAIPTANVSTDAISTGAVLVVRGLTRVHRDGDHEVIALDRVDLEIAPGELVAVTGRSGCGSPRCSISPGASTKPPRAR